MGTNIQRWLEALAWTAFSAAVGFSLPTFGLDANPWWCAFSMALGTFAVLASKKRGKQTKGRPLGTHTAK